MKPYVSRSLGKETNNKTEKEKGWLGKRLSDWDDAGTERDRALCSYFHQCVVLLISAIQQWRKTDASILKLAREAALAEVQIKSS